MARARAYNGVWRQSPQRRPRAEPLVGGSGDAETLFAFECLMEAAIRPFFLKFGNAISDAISHGDFNHTLYPYEKRPSNIVEFCNSCWKTAKMHLFILGFKAPVTLPVTYGKLR